MTDRQSTHGHDCWDWYAEHLRVERLAESLRLAEEHINDLTPEWYSTVHRVLAEIRAALRDYDKENDDV